MTIIWLHVCRPLYFISTENLPSTEHSASFHSMRTYLQVQAWLGRELSPEDWGFQLIHGQCRPIRMVEAPAPIELLKIIRCNCSQNCSTKVCTCKKFNLFCTVACGQCRGLSCCNREPSEELLCCSMICKNDAMLLKISLMW